MVKKLRAFNRFIDKANFKVAVVVSYLIIVLMLIVTYEVVMRYVFNRPTQWSLELNGFIFCTLVAFGGAYTMLTAGHVNVDIIYNRFNLRTRSIISLITFTLAFLFLGMVLWSGWGYASKAMAWGETSGSAWNPPIWPIKFLVPVGAFLLLTQVIVTYIRFFIQAKTGEKEIEDASDFLESGGEE